MTPLYEKYRPKSWDDVVGQDKVVTKIMALARRGLGGRAYWLSGQSGTGKTTIARLIAQVIADESNIIELDASQCTAAFLRQVEGDMAYMGMGSRPGKAYLINEAHGLRSSYSATPGTYRAVAGSRRDRVHHDFGRPRPSLRRPDRRAPALEPLYRASTCAARYLRTSSP